MKTLVLALTLLVVTPHPVNAAVVEDTVILTMDFTKYCVGASWNLKLSHAAPNAAIRLSGTLNNIPWEIPHWADTDDSGNFSTSGTYTTDAVGRYTLRAEIAGSISDTLPVEILNCAGNVMILSSGSTAFDAEIQTILRNHGHVVTIADPYFRFYGGNLQSQDVVLLLPNVNWAAGDMPLAGQNALVEFVANGGGLVTGEWTVWKWATDSFASLGVIFPVHATSDYSESTTITYTQATPDPLLNNGIPSSFTFSTDYVEGAETVLTPRLTATTFYGSAGSANGAGLVGWRVGAGHVLQFSTVVGPVALADARYSRLLANAVAWAARENRGPLVTEVRFDPETIRRGFTLTATFLGHGLLADTYFDVRFREPGSATNQVSFNWQRGATDAHTMPSNTGTGTWIVTGVRAHQEQGEHEGDFDPVFAFLTVIP